MKEVGECRFSRVDNKDDYLRSLRERQPDLIVSDYMMPAFDGMTALEIALEKMPDVPFIILTGSMNEETAVDCMKAGAWDYVIKEHVKRLGPAVRNTLKQKHLRRSKKKSGPPLETASPLYFSVRAGSEEAYRTSIPCFFARSSAFKRYAICRPRFSMFVTPSSSSAASPSFMPKPMFQ